MLQLSSSLTNDITSKTVQFLVNKEQILHVRGSVRKYPLYIALKQYGIT